MTCVSLTQQAIVLNEININVYSLDKINLRKKPPLYFHFNYKKITINCACPKFNQSLSQKLKKVCLKFYHWPACFVSC